MLRTLLILLLLPFCSLAQTGKEGAFGKGRTLTRWLQEGQIDSLFKYMSPEFKEAVGHREGMKSLAGQLQTQAGTEEEVLEEAAFGEAGHTTYYRISRYQKIPNATTRWVWDSTGTVIGATITPTPTPAQTDKESYKAKTPLKLPFKEEWYVAWGGRTPMLNHHISSPDQRFAYDFVVMKGDKLFRNEGAANEDYFGFGKPIYAPAAGKVVVAVDSIADNTPGEENNNQPAGNYVIIDHGNGEYSLLAHLKKGSLKVTPGKQVKAGDQLGLSGNSGNSSQPHLHYHLQTGAAFKAGLGLPAPFHKYYSGGRYLVTGEPARGEYVSPYENGIRKQKK